MKLRNLSLGLLSACVAMMGACKQSANKTDASTTMKDSIILRETPGRLGI